jgi:hypothetical protein
MEVKSEAAAYSVSAKVITQIPDCAPPEERQTVTGADAIQSSEPAARLGTLLASVQRDRDRRNRFAKLLGGACMICALLASAIGLAQGVSWRLLIHNYAFISFLNWTIYGSVCRIMGNKPARELMQVDDVSCVGPLIDVWAHPDATFDRKTRRMIQSTLTRLLPRLKASDAHLLTEQQRAALRNVIANNGYIAFGVHQNIEFMLAIVKGMEQIGDWRCEPIISIMAKTAKDSRLRDAARECLPFLQSLAAKLRVGETLLRPSAVTAIGSETLLRPAAADGKDCSSEVLLRPTSDE